MPFTLTVPERSLIVAASALANSAVFNPRRTEDTTYGIWTSVLIALTESSRATYTLKGQVSLLINPQYNIYISKQSDEAALADPNTSLQTEPDLLGKSNGVYTDIAVLRLGLKVLPERTQHHTRQTDKDAKKPFLSFIKDLGHHFFPHRRVWVTRDTTISILMELKPPPTRTPKNIQNFYYNLHNLLEAAQVQVERQALCMMCTRRFAKQNSVLLIAGAGDWWCCRSYTRQSVFGVGAFNLANDEGYAHPVDLEDDEAVEKDYDDFINVTNETVPNAVPEIRGVEQDPGVLKASAERLARAQLRDTINRTKDEEQLTMDELNQGASYPFTVDDLNACHRLRNPTKDENFIADDNAPIGYTSITSEWSEGMRLGTKASDKYLAVIEKRIRADP
ncbi:hypothetical protein GG344DRAFT_80096 [Lentinula edodes]|nr:hypothetical protein GG344DRAFT_80096 [Lentinula edodes]